MLKAVSPETNNRETPLPALRQDLAILPSRPFWNGAPSWMIFDGVANKYYRIGRREFLMLSCWEAANVGALSEKVAQTHAFAIAIEEIEAFIKFLFQNRLIEFVHEKEWQNLMQQKEGKRQALWAKLAHNYLFFRIPLFNPQPLLDAIWPFVSFLFTRAAALVLALLGAFSLFLVSRQWESFVATFVNFLTLEGLMLYGISLVFIKMMHEMGHAFMARKYEVEVPVIGAAFIVLMPILYTDTTAAHRLASRAQRLNIDFAGIYTELALAITATILWIFLPDGAFRSIAFTTATLSWVMSLAVNLNPFMRFDGYYILSDYLGFENLQDRGFAFGKWRMREVLFGLGERPPEAIPRSWHMPIVLHAWGTWIYRFFLFLGIALIVYAFFIKIVGILLFAIEITWFIALPVFRELKVWWSLRSKIMKTKRSVVTASFLLGLLALLFFPFKVSIEIPAIVRNAEVLSLFPPQDVLVAESKLRNGLQVHAGDPLVIFTSPDLEEERVKNRLELALLNARLERTSIDAEERSLKLIIEKELTAKKVEKKQLDEKFEELTYRAPITGKVFDVDTQITAGIWVGKQQQIGLISGNSGWEVFGYLEEDALGDIREGMEGQFIPDSLQLSKAKVKLSKFNPIPIDTLGIPLLADLHGGRIPIQNQGSPEAEQAPSPVGSWYQVNLQIDKELMPDAARGQITRGVVRLDGKRQSYASRIATRIAGVLLRELAP